MIRGVHESTIRCYMRLFEAEPALREANDALLHFARSHDIVNHWGTGFGPESPSQIHNPKADIGGRLLRAKPPPMAAVFA